MVLDATEQGAYINNHMLIYKQYKYIFLFLFIWQLLGFDGFIVFDKIICSKRRKKQAANRGLYYAPGYTRFSSVEQNLLLSPVL
jgi:hypothetical protein